jgi:hypothetical protein
MSSQLVDFNADGYNDILVGSFSGVPYMIKGSEEGFGEPEQITDANDQPVLIADFWNDESEKWDSTDRAESEGHCTSVSAVDWDDDGDLDLLLGDYYGGRLYLRKNEGNAKEPSFARTNDPVVAGGEPVVIENGLAAPRIVDWDGNGLFDILCGGAKGGVYLFKNVGQQSAPRFASAESLIEPVKDATKSYVKRVPAKNGLPTLPGSSYHIEPIDFDSDGDLDLLVGGQSSWLTGPQSKLTDEEKNRLRRINEQLENVLDKIRAISEKAESDEDREKLLESKEYRELIEKYQELAEAKEEYRTDPTESGDFVWIFRRK